MIASYVLVMTDAMATTSYDTWAAYVIGPLLVAITIPIVRRVARVTDEDRVIVTIMVLAVIVKLATALVRYEILFEVYGGVGDAFAYAGQGARLARSFGEGLFAVDLQKPIPGTGFIQLLTGLVFTVIGDTTLGGFLVFAWLAYWGVFLCYQALRIGLPAGNHRRYALLVFFLPSLLFWPSSIGKDAWMLFALGVAAFGASKMFAGTKRGAVWLVLGLAGMALVRPHISALVVVALLIALVPWRGSDSSSTGLVARVVMITVLIGVGSVLLQQVESYFGVEQGFVQAEEVLDEAERRTSQGGSGFSANRVESITDVPRAFLTVVFRPFPHEAHNAQAFLTSLEGVLLLGLFIASAGRLLQLLRTAWREPYVLFATAYSLLFVVAFSSFGNFGILARQRVQLFPVLLVLLVLPRADEWETALSQNRQRETSTWRG